MLAKTGMLAKTNLSNKNVILASIFGGRLHKLLFATMLVGKQQFV